MLSQASRVFLISFKLLYLFVSQVYKVEQIRKPLENYRDIDAFKIYVSDLGLLAATRRH